MSLKESQNTIDFQTVETLTTLLHKNRRRIVHNMAMLPALEPLFAVVHRLEGDIWETRLNKAAVRVSEMSEEERRVSLMGAKEKKFFLAFKETHPQNKWDYLDEYLKTK
jgi:hypothetical protein